MKRLPAIFLLAALLPVLFGCRSTPDEVLTPDEMADLLVDFHRGEALADLQYSRFREDSSRVALRQSIYERHGVTQADFDTSIAWYGRHVDKYVELYDIVIERLERQVEEAGNLASGTASFSGDSVNVWAESPYYVFTRRSPAAYIDFHVDRDSNWKNGDSYTWQFKVMNRLSDMQFGLNVDYDDGSTDYLTADVEQDGWNRLTVVLDSLRKPVSVYGFLVTDVRPDEEIYVDSLSLVRKRYDSSLYHRRYSQQKFRYGKSDNR